MPDAVVVEDPDTAGGHLGEKLEQIGSGDYDQYATVRGVKEHFRTAYGKDVPVIAAGGIWDRADLLHALEQGADGVQMATGCTFGKGLIERTEYGKWALSLVDVATRKAVRVSVKPETKARSWEERKESGSSYSALLRKADISMNLGGSV